MEESVRMIKKYPNRRLYDTATSSYITLADVKRLVLDQVEFQVIDAKSGENLTRSILLQIILEEESGGLPMFSSEMLTNIIRFYGNAMQGIMGGYLENNIQTFIDFQKKLQEQALTQPNAEVWGQFLKFQTPTLQGMMGNYLEQSANMFLEMQQQLQKQTRNMFGNFGFPTYGVNTDPRQEKTQETKPQDASQENKDKR